MQMELQVSKSVNRAFIQKIVEAIEGGFDEVQHASTAYVEDSVFTQQYGGDDDPEEWRDELRRATCVIIVAPYSAGDEDAAIAKLVSVVDALKLTRVHIKREGAIPRFNPERWRIYWRHYPIIKKVVSTNADFSPVDCEYYVQARIAIQPFFEGE